MCVSLSHTFPAEVREARELQTDAILRVLLYQ